MFRGRNIKGALQILDKDTLSLCYWLMFVFICNIMQVFQRRVKDPLLITNS